MEVGGHDDTECRARVYVDVGVDTPLADELQPRQFFQEWRADHGALSDENQRFGVGESFG